MAVDDERGIWEEPIPDAPLEDRTARLERVTQGYHDIVGEGGLLADAVGNLDTSAGVLATVLRQVELNQRQILAVRDATRETKKVVENIEEDRSAEKRRMRFIAFVTACVLFFIVLATTMGVVTYVRAVAAADGRYHQVSADICGRRNAQSRVMQAYLDQQVKQINAMKTLSPAQRDTYLKEAAQLRGAFPVVDCSKLTQP
jgi:hypothetical protein